MQYQHSYILKTLIFGLLALSLLPKVGQAQTYKLLWEIKSVASPETPPSYLFGTMHVTDENMFQLPDSVPIAIENTDGFATEVAFDEALNKTLDIFFDKGFSPRGGPSKQGLRKRVMDILGGEGPQMNPMKLFENFGDEYEPGQDRETFLDAFLYRIAREEGKVVGGLEDLETQMTLLFENDGSFKGERSSEGGNILKNAYVKGDLDAIQAYMESDAVSDDFRDIVLTKRNYGMVDVADSLIKVRPTFVAVGAGHLAGEEGMIALFRKKGYALRPVTFTSTGRIQPYLDKPYEPDWIAFDHGASGVRLDVPVRPFEVPILEGELSMNFGMDLPGGFFYAFYRMRMPGGINSADGQSTLDNIIEGLSDKSDVSERKQVQIGKFIGEEVAGNSRDYYFRTQVLFDDESLVFLLVGINEKTAQSEAADHFFKSLDTYTPEPLFGQEWKQRKFPFMGFEVALPGEPTFERDISYDDEDSLVYFNFQIFELDDLYHKGFFLLRTIDLAAHSAAAEDSIFLAFAVNEVLSENGLEELEPDFNRMDRNGIPGWETRLGIAGDSLHMRQVMYGNRTFLLTLQFPEESAYHDKADLLFESFGFLPLRPAKLDYAYSDEDISLNFSSEPSRLEDAWYASLFPGSDELLELESRDSLSLSSFYIGIYNLSPYFRAESLDSLFSILDKFHLEDPKWDGSIPASGPISYTRSYPSELEGEADIYVQYMLSGDLLTHAQVNMPPNQSFEAEMAKEFFDNIEFKSQVPVSALLSPKLDILLRDLKSEEDSLAAEALAALRDYNPAPEEVEVLLEELEKNTSLETEERVAVAEVLIDRKDPALLDRVRRVYLDSQDEEFQMGVLYKYVLVEDTLTNQKGAELLKTGFPDTEDDGMIEDFFYLLLYNDSLALLDPEVIAASSQHPYAFAEMAWSLRGQIQTEQLPLYDANVALDLCLGHAEEELEGKVSRYSLDENRLRAATLDYLVDMCEDIGWTPRREEFARKVMELAETAQGTYTAAALLRANRKVDAKVLDRLAQDERHSYDLLMALIETSQTNLVSKKYFKQKSLAEKGLRQYALDNAWNYGFYEGLSQVELLADEEVWHDGKEMRLYVFRCAFEGDSNWRLGISGPFPMEKGAFPGLLELSRITEDSYHPNKYTKQLRTLILDAQENLKEAEWDFSE